MSSILSVNNLSAGYNKSQVLFDISFNVEKGTICTILGPNGSGKSTILKTIFGLTNVYDGLIKFKNINITRIKPHKIARLGIAYLPQINSTYLNLTVRENLMMAGYILSKDAIEKRIKSTQEIFPELKKFMNRKVLTLSGGERQMVVMARALMRQPSLMMFDEPTAHLAPKISEQIFEKIKELNKNLNITVILVEQNVKKALEISDTVHLLVSGRINYSSTSKDLLSNKELGRLFLGL